MALKTYIFDKDYNAPYVVNTGRPDKPQKIMVKRFKKGDTVNGEMKHANNKPAVVLVDGVLPISLDVIKELTTKEIVSGADASTSATSEVGEKPEVKGKMKLTPSKLKYGDSAIIGAVIGFAGVYFAEKQGYIVSVDKKNRIYGAVAGAALGMYLVYRIKNK